MNFYGTAAGGFRVLRADRRTLLLEIWGYWEDDVLNGFARLAVLALEGDEPLQDVTIDAAMLKPQSSAGQEVLLAFLRRLAAKVPEQVSMRVDNVLTQMQLTRLARQSGLNAVKFSSLSGDRPPTH